MIKIHIPVPTNPARFYEGELREEFTLRAFLEVPSESDENTISMVYFNTSEGLYRIEKGDARLYIYPPNSPRYMIPSQEGQERTLLLSEPFIYGEKLLTSPVTEIVTIRYGHQLAGVKLDPSSKLYKL